MFLLLALMALLVLVALHQTFGEEAEKMPLFASDNRKKPVFWVLAIAANFIGWGLTAWLITIRGGRP